MLTLILGRAGSGKTEYMYSQIAKKVKARETGQILIVPEQYSHDAERSLSKSCGSTASLYAEVLSFSRICSRVFAETGGMAEKTLSKAGRLLCMNLALTEVAGGLHIYNLGTRKPEFLESLVKAYDELRSSRTELISLDEASNKLQGPLSDKLYDLAAIFSAFEAIKARSGRDARDRLDRLANDIGRSGIGGKGHIWIDGFSDFTAQELRIIRELLKKDTDITVCLTCEGAWDDDPVFKLPVETARGLMALANELGVRTEILNVRIKEDKKAPAIRYLEEKLFSGDAKPFETEAAGVEIYRAGGTADECALAAAKAVELLRKGYRMREIAIVSPNWEKYRSAAAGVFERYGLTVNIAEKSDIMEKPVMALVVAALDIIINNWDYVNLFRYLKTELTGIDSEERDELENYIIKWNIRGRNMWTRAHDWKMPPQGYSETLSDADMETLERINCLRRRISAPLSALHDGLTKNASAGEKVKAIYAFLEDIYLYSIIGQRAERLSKKGKLQLADEYVQLWDILTQTLEEIYDILGEVEISTEEMCRLFKLVLSQHQVGAIPTSMDAVGAGDMRRMRGRGVRCLIIMGATDDAMPSAGDESGIFSESERDELREMGIELPNSGEEALSRELNAIYTSFSLPTDYLMVSYPAAGRRSYILTRVLKILGISEKTAGTEIYTEAEIPCFELAATAGDGGADAVLSRRYFKEKPAWADKLRAVDKAAKLPRGRLSKLLAERLYGKKLNITASRVDKYFSCRFSYFLQYGLRAKPRKEAGLDAPEMGTFMHFILENVAREAGERGGFGKVPQDQLSAITERYVKEYAERKLGGLDDKSGRFRYLFRRLAQDAARVVSDMADELRSSDFEPVDFELRFAPDGEIAPPEITGEDGTEVKIAGVVDRVDGWVRGDELYLRVVDYKTGKKAFSLSDIWYGMGLQMLIYLFALQKKGAERYGKNIIPAGVLYAPARDLLINASHDLSDDDLEKERRKTIRRSGLLLDDPEMLEAMEHKDGGGYMPVKFTKEGVPAGDSLASLDRLGKLSSRIDRHLINMSKELRDGSIKADPYYRNQLDNACMYCDYFEACHFREGAEEDRYRYLTKLKTNEVWEKIEEAEK